MVYEVFERIGGRGLGMELGSGLVGKRFRPLEVTLTPRHCMNYAAAVGDDNPWYLDDERPEGLVAPPMIAVALTWQITGAPASFMEDGPLLVELLPYGVHYSETLQWHRSMLPGERLKIVGEIVALLPHRSGTYVVTRYEATDEKGGPVFTEHFGWLFRGVSCNDGGRGAEALPRFPEAPTGGTSIWAAEMSIGQMAAHVYDGCADIHNPIHTSRRFARSVGLPENILHGTATLAMAVKEIVDREAGRDPRRMRALGCRFSSMVFLGTTASVQLLARVEGAEGTMLFFEVLTKEGKKAIRDGVVFLSHV
jgi:acyl dehydratase